jgi:hypothetical protein
MQSVHCMSGTPARSAHPPQLLRGFGDAQATLVMLVQVHVPPPHAPHSAPGVPSSGLQPPHAFTAFAFPTHAMASCPLH